VIATVQGPVASAAVATEEDRTLYGLIAERLALMRSVAAYKWLNGIPIEDREREALVIASAEADGLRHGMRPDTTARFFAIQIEAAKDIQRYWFERWSAGGAPEEAADLSLVIRPQLIELGNAILTGIADGQPANDLTRFQTAVDLEGLTDTRTVELFTALEGIERFDNRFEQIRSTGQLRVGTTGDYAPFSFSEDGVDFEGIDIDLARDLAAHLGVRVVFVQTSWPTLLDDLGSGAWDIAMSGVSRTEPRAEVGYLSLAYYTGGKTPIARCDRKREFTTLADIDRRGVRVVVNPGGTNELFVDTRIRKAEKILHEDNRTIFEALITGAADVMITDRIEVTLQARRHDSLCSTMAENLTHQEKGYLMPRDELLNEALDRWLTGRLEAGIVGELIENHLDR
jgi:cyclohexadienyl dehydratase